MLTPEERKVCSLLGTSEAEFEKAKELDSLDAPAPATPTPASGNAAGVVAAKALVHRALADGTLQPNQRAWALDYAEREPVACKTFLEGHTGLVAGAAPQPDAGALTSTEKAMLRELRFSPSRYLELKAQGMTQEELVVCRKLLSSPEDYFKAKQDEALLAD